MNRKYTVFLASFFVAAVAFFVISCSKGSNKTEEPTTTFDRKVMLTNFADNLIKPAFVELNSSVVELQTTTAAFVAQPSPNSLTLLQSAWDKAYSSWMYANAYNFGPAGEEGIRKGLVEEIGTWPANTVAIESNILANDISLADFNRDNRGFHALDYLLFNSSSSLQSIVDKFLSSENRKTYLTAVVAKLVKQVQEVSSAWTGSYASTFVNNAGTDVGSSTSQLYNEFVRSFESIKNFKLGLPLGLRVGQVGAEPSKVEARYSAQSVKYLKMHLLAIQNIWFGKSKTGTDGVGWKEYLNSVTGGGELVTRTETELAVINSALQALPESPSLAQQIENNKAPLITLHTELQKNTRNFKSDMSSLLGIAITFSSGDGD